MLNSPILVLAVAMVAVAALFLPVNWYWTWKHAAVRLSALRCSALVTWHLWFRCMPFGAAGDDSAYRHITDTAPDTCTACLSKRFYSTVKSKRNDTTSDVAPLHRNSITYSDAKVKANILNYQFVSIFSKDSSNVSNVNLIGDPYPEMDMIQITPACVSQLLKNLHSHKANGPGRVPSHLLKVTADEVEGALRLIFQASLTQGTVPSD